MPRNNYQPQLKKINNSQITIGFILVGMLFCGCFKDLTIKNIVYENDFEAGWLNSIYLGGWINNNSSFSSISSIKTWDYNGSKVLGKFNSNVLLVGLSKLPSHQSLRVELDLFIHNQWNNDLWKMDFDGTTQLLTGFSNDMAIQQSYPNWIGNGLSLNPAGTEAQNTRLIGVCSSSNIIGGTSQYHLITTIFHTSPYFTLACSDAGGTPNDTCRRSWSIDNLKITVFKN